MAGRKWTYREIELVKEHYPFMDCKDVAKLIGRTEHAVYNAANILQLHKSDEWQTFDKKRRAVILSANAAITQFKKGNLPWNTGTKGATTANSTSFKIGHTPANTKHFGKPFLMTRFRENGYVEQRWVIRVDKKLIGYLKYLCEQQGIDMTGKVPVLPVGYDMNKLPVFDDITIITRKRSINRNSPNRYPEALRQLILAKKQLTKELYKL